MKRLALVNNSDGKDSACNPGDLGLIPESGSGERNGNPLQYSCLENSMGRGAWRATVHGVTESQTWLRDQQYNTIQYSIGKYTGKYILNYFYYFSLKDMFTQKYQYLKEFIACESQMHDSYSTKSRRESGRKWKHAFIIYATIWYHFRVDCVSERCILYTLKKSIKQQGLQTYLKDSACSIPDHKNKAQILLHKSCFPVHMKAMFILYYTLLSVQQHSV